MANPSIPMNDDTVTALIVLTYLLVYVYMGLEVPVVAGCLLLYTNKFGICRQSSVSVCSKAARNEYMQP